MIAQGCKKWIIKPASLCILTFILAIITNQFIVYLISIIFLAFTVFFIIFFRDPERKIPKNPKVIVAPADGTVIKIDNIGNFSITNLIWYFCYEARKKDKTS